MVVVRQGDSEFNADGLEYDDNTRLLTLHGNVHALMQPALRKSVATQERRQAMTAPLLFITGASSGIGQAMALEWARRGGRLALVARRGDEMRAWVARAGLVGRSRGRLRGRRARRRRDDRRRPRLHRGAGAARRRHRQRRHQRRRRPERRGRPRGAARGHRDQQPRHGRHLPALHRADARARAAAAWWASPASRASAACRATPPIR